MGHHGYGEAPPISWPFSLDANLDRVAQAYAADLVDLAAKPPFELTLDYSDDSLWNVEKMAERLEAEFSLEKAGASAVQPAMSDWAKAIGFYLGEVFRRHHGANWGWIDPPDGDRFAGMWAARAGLFWPIGKAMQRLTNGAEDNIWTYFLVLAAKSDGEPRVMGVRE